TLRRNRPADPVRRGARPTPRARLAHARHRADDRGSGRAYRRRISGGFLMADLPLAANLGIFGVGAGAIWGAGAPLEDHPDALAVRTGMGHAFTGMLLLAGATSLPELATTVTAVVLLDNPTLAVHNLVGGVAFQTMILVFADASKGRSGALTYFSPKFVLLI